MFFMPLCNTFATRLWICLQFPVIGAVIGRTLHKICHPFEFAAKENMILNKDENAKDVDISVDNDDGGDVMLMMNK